ncbi:uncharacterized protein LOC105201057 isoform X2 [Solenopsis invicta]|nr:uncharacterized protein LOC105201057 isoform X2 [Solenopsis invicta]XP_039315289.1 uncharacterized protein LOC105201057 isoform X2 [Solenopsis invicta]XP_039315290.1 uncharacterized protein LOC105201057 isoform X2 [Solenopsis invicta]XP_039315291.1 uncharacterized protein LOC105201057 isoform X2 [Solenopsis invicta]XP_039315292.1 uncharacterized protein LOC105201057 isoform X2 [Solenopsis invicta]XP_039315294.1 uncharacterized protein LOC105201057 isoform X2 [Solenopsis invicta]
MCQQRDNLETYGVLEPSRGKRKSMCRIQWSDDEEELKDGQEKKNTKSEAINNTRETLNERHPINDKMVDFGGTGVLISASRLKNCNRNSISQYTCDLLSVVFFKEELASSSLTGKVANTMKEKNVIPKTRLDPKRLEAIEGKKY